MSPVADGNKLFLWCDFFGPDGLQRQRKEKSQRLGGGVEQRPDANLL